MNTGIFKPKLAKTSLHRLLAHLNSEILLKGIRGRRKRDQLLRSPKSSQRLAKDLDGSLGRNRNQWGFQSRASQESVDLTCWSEIIACCRNLQPFLKFPFYTIGLGGFQTGRHNGPFFLSWAGIVKWDCWFHPRMLAGTRSTTPKDLDELVHQRSLCSLE